MDGLGIDDGSFGTSLNVWRQDGLKIDPRLKQWAEHYDEDPGRERPATIAVTPRQLGCTEHPLQSDLRDSCLKAWSRENLEPGYGLDLADEQFFITNGINRLTKKGSTITQFGRLWISKEPCALQAVYTAYGERWLNAVPLANHRFSLDEPILFAVRKRSRTSVAMRTQPKPSGVKVTSRSPAVYDDMTPGRHCGPMAVRSILGAYGIAEPEDPLRALSAPGLMGVWQRRHGNLFMPWHLVRVLGQCGVLSEWHIWGRASFKERLARAIHKGQMVVTLTYAQRRQHGQHYEVVAGYEVYQDKRFWYTTDGHFAKREYRLPRGNVLLSTDDFLRSFPKYGFGFWAPFCFVVVVDP